jgi:hypothetical protein
MDLYRALVHCKNKRDAIADLLGTCPVPELRALGAPRFTLMVHAKRRAVVLTHATLGAVFCVDCVAGTAVWKYAGQVIPHPMGDATAWPWGHRQRLYTSDIAHTAWGLVFMHLTRWPRDLLAVRRVCKTFCQAHDVFMFAFWKTLVGDTPAPWSRYAQLQLLGIHTLEHQQCFVKYWHRKLLDEASNDGEIRDICYDLWRFRIATPVHLPSAVRVSICETSVIIEDGTYDKRTVFRFTASGTLLDEWNIPYAGQWIFEKNEEGFRRM